jgi:hypothetical protein
MAASVALRAASCLWTPKACEMTAADTIANNSSRWLAVVGVGGGRCWWKRLKFPQHFLINIIWNKAGTNRRNGTTKKEETEQEVGKSGGKVIGCGHAKIEIKSRHHILLFLLLALLLFLPRLFFVIVRQRCSGQQQKL